MNILPCSDLNWLCSPQWHELKVASSQEDSFSIMLLSNSSTALSFHCNDQTYGNLNLFLNPYPIHHSITPLNDKVRQYISNGKVPYVRNPQFRKKITKAFLCPVLVLCNLNLIGKFFHPLPMGFIISFFQKISERKYILWKVFFSQHFWRSLDILLRRWYRRKCSWKGFLFNKDFSFCIFVPY